MTQQDKRNLAFAQEAEAALDGMHFNILPGAQPTHEQQKQFETTKRALADLINLLKGEPTRYHLKSVAASATKGPLAGVFTKEELARM